jgi:hypothetical protein
MRLRLLTFSSALMLAACAPAPPRTPTTPFFQSVRQLNADGTRAALDADHLSPFQQFMRARLTPSPRGIGPTAVPHAPASAKTWNPFTKSQAPSPAVLELFTLEVDLAGGEGNEGAYAAVVLLGDARTGRAAAAEFQYYEQAHFEPRHDRYFHRLLTDTELADLQSFIASQPIDTLRVAPRPVNVPATSDAAEAPAAPMLTFRFTRATPREASAVVISNPSDDDHPAIDLVRIFSTLRDARPPAPPLACRYLRTIPADAAVLFADPQRRAVELSVGADHLRVRIEPALPDDIRPPESPHWYAQRGGTWLPTAPPGSPESPDPLSPTPPPGAAAPPPSSAPAPKPGPAFPLLPRRPGTAELLARAEARPAPLPRQEGWTADPRGGHTVLTHYIPRLGDPRIAQAESRQVVIPGLEFDTAHMAFAPGHTSLYVIHDGHVIALPLPGTAR